MESPCDKPLCAALFAAFCQIVQKSNALVESLRRATRVKTQQLTYWPRTSGPRNVMVIDVSAELSNYAALSFSIEMTNDGDSWHVEAEVTVHRNIRGSPSDTLFEVPEMRTSDCAQFIRQTLDAWDAIEAYKDTALIEAFED
jgi:hypothetical protein